MDKGIELRIAIHEAGHAIVCLDQDHKFDSIDMLQNGFEFGHIKGAHTMNKENNVRDELGKVALMLLGGHAADCIFFKKQPADLFKSSLNGSKKDFEGLAAMGKQILNLTDDELPSFIDSIMVQSLAIVDRRWSDLNKLAVELMRKKKLSYQECKALIN